jgi:hypothetical protein
MKKTTAYAEVLGEFFSSPIGNPGSSYVIGAEVSAAGIASQCFPCIFGIVLSMITFDGFRKLVAVFQSRIRTGVESQLPVWRDELIPENPRVEMSEPDSLVPSISCDICGQLRRPGINCVKTIFFLSGKSYLRRSHEGDGNCPDCGTPRGGFHHMGCRVERCPRCGDSLLACGCFDTGHEVLI